MIGSAARPNGGFYMTEKARKMPVRIVLEAMNEDDLLNKCILGLSKCSETKPCPMHAQYKLVKEQLIKLLKTKTIQRLADDFKSGEVFISNRHK